MLLVYIHKHQSSPNGLKEEYNSKFVILVHGHEAQEHQEAYKVIYVVADLPLGKSNNFQD
jgi:hypothetical protein